MMIIWNLVMFNLNNIIDFSFYLRGFLAFVFVPSIFILNISPLDTFLLHSNVYLNNYRFPNLNQPAYFCILYFFSTYIFLFTYHYFYKLSATAGHLTFDSGSLKININYNLKFSDKIKNVNAFCLYVFLIILFLKLRVFYDLDYLDKYRFSGDLLFNNFYVYLFVHLLLPNELVFLLLSFYFDKGTKSRLINSVFIIYIISVLVCSVIFGSRLILVTSLIMMIFLFFKFKKKLKPLSLFLILGVVFFIIINFLPYKILGQYNDFLNYFVVIFDHFVWRLDMYHLVDLGFSSGDTSVIDTNSYGRKHGIMTMGDIFTGIEFPLFFDYIKVDNSLLINTTIIIFSAFCMAFFYEIIKLFSLSLGNFFFAAFLFKFCATWPEMGADQITTFLFKLIVILSLIQFYIYFEKNIKIFQIKSS